MILLLLSTTLFAGDPEPLHVRIDRAVEAAHAGAPTPVGDDATFVRRLHLDLTGRIPTSHEARAFLDDPAADKRAKLVHRLLGGPEHVRHMVVSFDVWLMERRADKHVKADEWRAWLGAAFAANRPYNELVRDILGADGADPLQRPAAKFTLDRDVAPDALARDVGRLLFGMDLQCAQCHDHPRIEDYLQRDYYGLYAFLNRTALFQPDPKKPGVVMEKPDGDASFKSVFTKAEGSTRPRLPDGAEIEEPSFPRGEEYQVRPDPKNKGLRPLPKFSRRAQLARLAGEGNSRAFGRNAANRLWAHMMGRGLVEPVDLHHTDNPPSHPELLEMLAAEFAAMKYDIRAFLRQLALTRTYQRAIEMPATVADQAKTAAARLPAFEAEAKTSEAAASKAEEASKKAVETLEAAMKDVAPVAAEFAKAQAAVTEARTAHEAALQARDAAQKDLAARQDLRKSVSEAAEKAAAAAARLSGDAELAAAVATFRARAGKLAGEAAAGTQDLADKTAAAAAKAGPLAESEKAAGAVQARLTGANARLKTLADARAEAGVRRKSAKVAASVATRRAADARALVDYGALHAAAAASREQAQRVGSELALAKSPDELAAREAKAAEAKKAHEASLKAAEAARRALADKEEALKAVSEAAGKAEEVATKAAKDAELTGAAARVRSTRDRLNAEVAELRKAVPRRDEAARKAADQVAAAERARAEGTSAKEKLAQLESQARPAAEKAAADEARREEAFDKLTTIWAERFLVADLSALTPEQVAWSMMQATGVVELQRAAAAAEVAKKTPPVADADRAKAVEDLVYEKLKGNEAPFVKLYGAGPGQPPDEFCATVDQALFLANGGLVRGWMAPAAGNLIDRLMKTEDPKELSREVYLGVFTRRPTEGEMNEVTQYLAKRPQARLAAIQEIVWAMLSSVEFRFKH